MSTSAHEVSHEATAGHGHHPVSPFIQHHFEDEVHQFESGKLGIWLFLAQEILFFSALFVAYIIYRNHHPDVFAYAHKYLDVRKGALNTIVLICSSLSAAWAVRAAQLNQRKLLIGCLIFTIVCAFGFLGIKYTEYAHKYREGALYGKHFKPEVTPNGTELGPDGQPLAEGAKEGAAEGAVAGAHAGAVAASETDGAGAAAKGAMAGAAAGAHAGATAGVQAGGSATEAGVAAGAKAGAKAAGATEAAAAAVGPKAQGGTEAAAVEAAGGEQGGHSEEAILSGPPPPNTGMFFTLYFAMTGLHGIHVVAGIIVFIWLLIRAFKGHFNENYYGPVDFAALYWHLVDIIWIFLFPLLYLIH